MPIGTARDAKPFSLGFDCVAPISDQVARLARAAGFTWVGRYVETLTPVERDTLFLRGLGIAPLTYAVTSQPLTAALGTQTGRECAGKLSALGCPPTVHLWCDHATPYEASTRRFVAASTCRRSRVEVAQMTWRSVVATAPGVQTRDGSRPLG